MGSTTDLLAGHPELLAIAERLEASSLSSASIPATRSMCADIATLLDAVRSLIQQTHDLRADEGRLQYEVIRIVATRYGINSYSRGSFETLRQASEEVSASQRHDTKGANVTYQIVAVRRHVVQTVRAAPQAAKPRRTRAEVLAAQATPSGCCDRHADNSACDCLEDAADE